MIETDNPASPTVHSLFHTYPHSLPIIHAALEGSAPHRIFVDRPDAPQAALLWVQDAFFYLAGDPQSPALQVGLLPLLFDRLLPEMSEPELVLFAPDEPWREAIDHLLAPKNAIRIQRKQFAFNPRRFADLAASAPALPAGLALMGITADIAAKHPHLAPLADPPTRRFGVCVLDGEELICECTAVFVGAGQAEIDIHTREDHQGRGLAALAAREFIYLSLSRGLQPAWSCWPERETSIALAAKLGFNPLPDMPAHLWAADL